MNLATVLLAVFLVLYGLATWPLAAIAPWVLGLMAFITAAVLVAGEVSNR